MLKLSKTNSNCERANYDGRTARTLEYKEKGRSSTKAFEVRSDRQCEPRVFGDGGDIEPMARGVHRRWNSWVEGSDSNGGSSGCS